ncbi:hypothetical protein OG713_40565 [Streptomyces sp. NBC_00723]|uniref:hypothetical protein n=1 Tax=Streptomyces sp. NBC_00723 TaxID=2903673 RepID=UPI00386CBA3B
MVFGPWLLVPAPLVVLMGCSRIRLRCHTAGQVSIGFLTGAAVSSPVFDLVS